MKLRKRKYKVGDIVTVEKGNANNRALEPNGRTTCQIVQVLHGVIDNRWYSYKARFPNGHEWYITEEDIIEEKIKVLFT